MEIFDEILGLNIARILSQTEAIPTKIMEKFEKYQKLRSNKQFIQSDALRKEIEALGYSIRDTDHGPYVVKRFF